ncbi:MAG: hypothetical protein PHI19_05890 [Clostridia bacterium]|nr:hypothetical protein [Clostridia bacterium]MDD3947351.1 hypothetical protein [Clostridia bacterium]
MNFRVEKRRFDEGNSSAIVEENRRFYAERAPKLSNSVCILGLAVNMPQTPK